MTIKLTKGDKAPEFTLLDQDQNEVSLNQFVGQKVLLFFYPRASTPGCTTQCCAVSETKDNFLAFKYGRSWNQS